MYLMAVLFKPVRELTSYEANLYYLKAKQFVNEYRSKNETEIAEALKYIIERSEGKEIKAIKKRK